MKTTIFLTLAVTVSIIYAFVEYSISIQYKIIFRVLFIFLIFCWMMWEIFTIKATKHYKQSRQFRWYIKMGMLESGYFLDTKYAKRYWKNLIGEFLR